MGRRCGGSLPFDDINSLSLLPPSSCSQPNLLCGEQSLLFDGMAGRHNARKRKKKAAAPPVGKDPFNYLPDDVLGRVLSFLSSKEAVQTSMVARRWRHTWKSVPSLRIFASEFDTVDQLKSFVNTLIELRDPTAPLNECEIPPFDGIDSWLQYAISCKVKVLKVEMPDFNDHGFLSNDSVISKHLTRLEIYHVIFEDDHSLDLSSCQALEVLDLGDCHIKLGDFVCPNSLRHLRLFDVEFEPANIRARISAPSLVTCELSDCRSMTPLFVSLPSVITAFIKIICDSEQCEADESEDEYCEGFCCKDDCSVLLESLSGATNLELICDDNCEIFSRELKWCPTFGNLKTLLLNDWCVTHNFAGIIHFLQHSPILERLTLQLRCNEESSIKTIASYTTKENIWVSKHLKVVEIKCYKVKHIQICQIVHLLGMLGVTWERINIEDDFLYYDSFSFEQTIARRRAIEDKIIALGMGV